MMMTIPFHPSSQMRLDREHLRATTLTTLTSACLSKSAGCFFSRLFCLFLQQKPSIGQYAIGHRIKRGKQCLALTTSFVFDCVCPWLVLNILSVYMAPRCAASSSQPGTRFLVIVSVSMMFLSIDLNTYMFSVF